MNSYQKKFYNAIYLRSSKASTPELRGKFLSLKNRKNI